MEPENILVDKIIKEALAEDIGEGDITSGLIIEKDTEVKAEIISGSEGILAGFEISKRVFQLVDSGIKLISDLKDGDKISKNAVILNIEGNARSVLISERTALNFLSHLSGIATLTNYYSEKADKYGISIRDTRKTTPLLRAFEKYAVSVGGGVNHRFGLDSGIIIKDNHLKIIELGNAVDKAKKKQNNFDIEVEVTNFKELKEAVDSGADIIMLDNMTPEEVRKAIGINNGICRIEVSGGVNKKNFGDYLIDGIDYISIGEITSTIKPLDFSLEFI
ncbi:MAG: carboxylating nicotinate-nucleotide diphosphorylase [Actinomycetia bacterium]|nr:carboxylating nicotinate-nucleotide diphosphorylase [Actinomycetes bacterium]